MSVLSDSLVISASEAVLLGRTLEEYLQADDYDYKGDSVWFLHFLWTRLCPFYPVMDRPRTESIKNADLPGDIQWDVSAKPVLRFGFSPSLPDAFFFECIEPPMADSGCRCRRLVVIARRAVRCLELFMSHKCAQSGCGFHLPDNYPLPFCPWHAAPGNGLVKLVGAAGLFALGVGGFYAFGKIRDLIRKGAEQEELEQNADDTVEVPEPQMHDDGYYDAAYANGNGFDPYKVLGVGRSASVQEIEAAYRERVLKHHPDRGGDGWAIEQVHAAYEQIRPSISRRAAAGAVVVAARQRPTLPALRPKPAVPAARPPVVDVPRAARKAKSAVLAALLAFLFGPFGMFYSTVTGALVLFAADLILLPETFGLILFIRWPLGIVWAVVAANGNST